MLSYQIKDDHIENIVTKSGLTKVNLTKNYRIHGTVLEDRPPVLIEFDPAFFNAAEFTFLSKLFKDKIEMQIRSVEEKGKHPIYIGLRMDVRQNEKLSVALLKTIIYHLEKKLAIKKGQEIKIPVFA